MTVTVGDVPSCEHGPFLCDDAEDTFAAVNALDAGRIASGGASRFDPDVITKRLAVARRRISDAGCTANAYTERGYTTAMGGTFDASGIEGTSSDGGTVLAGAVSRTDRSFAATFDDASTLGDLTATYDRNGRMAANFGPDGFFAGRFIRVRGVRGVWVGLAGPCDDPTLAPVQSWLGAFEPLLVD